MLTRKEFLKAMFITTATAFTSMARAQTAGKALVIYYSWSGNTRQVAQAIAKSKLLNRIRKITVKRLTLPENNYVETNDRPFKMTFRIWLNTQLFCWARQTGGATSACPFSHSWIKTTCPVRSSCPLSPMAVVE